MCHKVPDGPTRYWDVDDTLITWREVTDDEIAQGVGYVEVYCNGRIAKKIPLTAHIEELKTQYNSGSFNIVWSYGGSDWAEAVVKALELQDYVHVIVGKPYAYYDDKDCDEWMPRRRWFVTKQEIAPRDLGKK